MTPRRVFFLIAALAALLALFGLVGCGASRVPAFELVAELGEAGPWPDGRYAIAEISAGGIAVFDADGDGRPDIYHVRHPPPDAPDSPAPNALYRQTETGSFEAVAGALGLDDAGYGNGVALGDVDGDGKLDVLVANLGADRLFLSGGAGRYRDATRESGIDDDAWSSSAAFLDYDRDGDLDLWVTRYVTDDPSQVCRISTSEPRDYCGPDRYQSVTDTLWNNDGGRFRDVSRSAGITAARSSFGLVCRDFSGDGWVDVYVANDMQPNQLFVNQRDGTFVDRAAELGVAVNGVGRPEASMGVAIGDVDGNGRDDIFLTHLVDQTNTIYRALDGAGYEDRSGSSGLGAPSLERTGWGCALADLDLDGDLDVAVANGRILRGAVEQGSSDGPFWNPYAERIQIFRGDGRGRFVEEVPAAGDAWGRPLVGRALVAADLDGDGTLDLVLATTTGRVRVLRNRLAASGSAWVAFRAIDSGRDAFGASIALEVDGSIRTRPVISSAGFQSAVEPIVHFGLGRASAPANATVTWNDGIRERFAVARFGLVQTLERGRGARD